VRPVSPSVSCRPLPWRCAGRLGWLPPARKEWGLSAGCASGRAERRRRRLERRAVARVERSETRGVEIGKLMGSLRRGRKFVRGRARCRTGGESCWASARRRLSVARYWHVNDWAARWWRCGSNRPSTISNGLADRWTLALWPFY